MARSFDLLKDARRRAIGIDLLGHGEAPKPTEPEAYDDLETPVLEQFPDSPADVIGSSCYSLGAHTALGLAMSYPERVNRLVLAAIGRNVVDFGDSRPLEGNVEARFESLITAPGNDSDALRACLARERRPFTVEQLGKVQAPCLIVIGSEDFAGPPEPLADALPNATVKIIAGIDHFGLPKQFGFIDAALEFIDAIPQWD